MRVAGYSARGPREANEDSYYVRDFSDVDSFSCGVTAFVLVSDGMGGYQGGDVASGIVVASAKSYVSQLLDMAKGNRVELDPAAALSEMARNAHDAILAEARSRGNTSMGATLVAAFVSPTHAWVAHLGDSRCYLLRQGEARQLTEDHSRVGRMLSQGVITEREAQNHPERNKIERALGFSDPAPDVNEVDLTVGDALLLCSDGVYTVVDGATLASIVGTEKGAEKAAEAVVRLALKSGTDDNATAVVLANGGAQRLQRPKGPSRPTTRTFADRNAFFENEPRDGMPTHIVVVIVLLVGVCMGMLVVSLLHNALVFEGGGSVVADQSVMTSTQGEGTGDGDALVDGSSQPPEGGSLAGTHLGDAAYHLLTIPEGTRPELKYVDAQGLANLFSYEPLYVASTAHVAGGVTLTVSKDERSFGRPGKSYVLLSDDYLGELRQDVLRAQEGDVSFDSLLSRRFDEDEYRQFVIELGQVGVDAFDAAVAHLIIEVPTVSIGDETHADGSGGAGWMAQGR